MKQKQLVTTGWMILSLTFIVPWTGWLAQAAEKSSSYAPVDIKEDFQTILKRMNAEKPKLMKRQLDLLNERYDLGDRPAGDVAMFRGKLLPGRRAHQTAQGRNLGEAIGHEPG
jgi:hypothetical protein